jgi:hypothetical protein
VQITAQMLSDIQATNMLMYFKLLLCLNSEVNKEIIFLFLPFDVVSCCASIQLVLYDAVNRNKISIRQLRLYFPSHSLHVSVRYAIRYF